MAPGKAHVGGFAHLCAKGNPLQGVFTGFPVGAEEDAGLAEDGVFAVAEGDGIVCKPCGEGRAATLGYGLAELAVEGDELERTFRHDRHGTGELDGCVAGNEAHRRRRNRRLRAARGVEGGRRDGQRGGKPDRG